MENISSGSLIKDFIIQMFERKIEINKLNSFTSWRAIGYYDYIY